MSWADANLNEDPVDVLAKRIVDLEDTMSTQLDQLRNEIGVVISALRDLTARVGEGLETGSSDDPMDTPATSRDIARLNTRIDELRALLLG